MSFDLISTLSGFYLGDEGIVSFSLAPAVFSLFFLSD